MSETLDGKSATAKPVSEIMNVDLVTVTPETPTLEAIQLMRENRISCLPVVEDRDRHGPARL